MTRRATLIAAAIALAFPSSAFAQGGNCSWAAPNGSVTRSSDGLGLAIISVSGGLIINCPGGVEIRSNEANIFEASRESHLFGDVVFQDPGKRLTSTTAIYSAAIGRLHATGNVIYTDRNTGSTLRGPDVEYYRVIAGRPQPQVIARQRPHLTLVPEGGATAGQQPLDVDGDRITVVGNVLTAVGSVILKGEQLNATSQEAYYDRGNGSLQLTGSARLIDERFNLVGDEITASMAGGERLQRLTARRNARLTGEDVNLAGEEIEATLDENEMLERLVARQNAELAAEELRVAAPQLHLFFARDSLQRLVAMRGSDAGAARPVATAENFRLEADSLEALMPGQQLRQVVAIGGARGEAWDTARTPAVAIADDSVAALLPTRDWLEGDTVTGYFAASPEGAPRPAARGDGRVVLERLHARGAARSLYRLEKTDTAAALPPLNYLAGETIELSFEGGELNLARVTGLQRGIYFDPSQAGRPARRPGGEGTPAPGVATTRAGTP